MVVAQSGGALELEAAMSNNGGNFLYPEH